MTASDRWLLFRAYIALAQVDLSLRWARLWRIERLVGKAPIVGPVATASEVSRARRYAYWIDVASRHHVVNAKCLHRSLALDNWLRGEGLSPALRIGVRKEGPVLKAHAWVVLGQTVVNDTPEVIAAFTPLSRPVSRKSADIFATVWR